MSRRSKRRQASLFTAETCQPGKLLPRRRDMFAGTRERGLRQERSRGPAGQVPAGRSTSKPGSGPRPRTRTPPHPQSCPNYGEGRPYGEAFLPVQNGPSISGFFFTAVGPPGLLGGVPDPLPRGVAGCCFSRLASVQGSSTIYSSGHAVFPIATGRASPGNRNSSKVAGIGVALSSFVWEVCRRSTPRGQVGVLESKTPGPPRHAGEFVEELDVVGAFR